MTTPMTGNREFRDDVVRVATLTVTDPKIEGYTFVNCQIIGPAVLALIDSVTMTNCVYEADVNSLFWEVDPATRPLVFGAVGLVKCSFYSCAFQAIGFAGTHELREQMEAAVVSG